MGITTDAQLQSSTAMWLLSLGAAVNDKALKETTTAQPPQSEVRRSRCSLGTPCDPGIRAQAQLPVPRLAAILEQKLSCRPKSVRKLPVG